MDFDLTKDQKLIRASVREFLEKECPPDRRRELDADTKGYDPTQWRKMAKLGWMGIPFPEEYGGTGGDFLDLMIVMEEMGRHAFPGPFFSTMVFGGLTLLKAGNEDQKRAILPKVADGDIILTMALAESSARYDASGVTLAASFDKDGYVINGTKLFVPDANIADYLLCVARTRECPDPEEGVTIFIVDTKTAGLTCTPLKTITRDKQNEVVFDHVQVNEKDIIGRVDGGWIIVKEALERAAVAQCAEMIGGAQAAMDMALQYAKKRIQFDRPIGSFQAVQHYFADMWISIIGCRHLIYKAGWKTEKGEPAGKEAAMAKARTGRVYRMVTALAHQIFGAIGFTLEHDMHLYYRRAIGGDLSFGDADFQKEKVAEALGL